MGVEEMEDFLQSRKVFFSGRSLDISWTDKIKSCNRISDEGARGLCQRDGVRGGWGLYPQPHKKVSGGQGSWAGATYSIVYVVCRVWVGQYAEYAGKKWNQNIRFVFINTFLLSHTLSLYIPLCTILHHLFSFNMVDISRKDNLLGLQTLPTWIVISGILITVLCFGVNMCNLVINWIPILLFVLESHQYWFVKNICFAFQGSAWHAT